MGPVRTETDAELAARLRLSVTRLARRLRTQAGDAVTASQVSALSSLACGGPMTLGELSHVERVKPPTMTRIVTALEEAGLVSRTVDPADRRVARVRVTDLGNELLERSRRSKDAYLADRLGRLAGGDRVELSRAVDALERLLDGPR